MTDNEIVKALECCIASITDCRNCPYYIVGDGDCVNKTKADVIDLVKRQYEEIERLTKYNTDVAYKHYNDGVKDFAKRIISYIDVGHLCSPTMLRWSDLSVKEMVEHLAKEMVGADNEID